MTTTQKVSGTKIQELYEQRKSSIRNSVIPLHRMEYFNTQTANAVRFQFRINRKDPTNLTDEEFFRLLFSYVRTPVDGDKKRQILVRSSKTFLKYQWIYPIKKHGVQTTNMP